MRGVCRGMQSLLVEFVDYLRVFQIVVEGAFWYYLARLWLLSSQQTMKKWCSGLVH